MHLLCEPNTFTSLVFIMHLLYEPNTCKNLVYHASAVRAEYVYAIALQAYYVYNPGVPCICCASLIHVQPLFITHLLYEPNTFTSLVYHASAVRA
jgi:hypothetical protein